MKLVFEVNKKFEKDLKRLSPENRHQVVYKINANCALLKNKPTAFFRRAQRPLVPCLAKGLKSSLYTLRIDKNLRVILAIDEDPVFSQTIVTLIRVVRHDDLRRTFRGIAEALYQKELLGLKPGKDDGAD